MLEEIAHTEGMHAYTHTEKIAISDSKDLYSLTLRTKASPFYGPYTLANSVKSFGEQKNNRSAGWTALMSIDVAHSGATETHAQRKAYVPVDSYSIVRVTLCVGELLHTNAPG